MFGPLRRTKRGYHPFWVRSLCRVCRRCVRCWPKPCRSGSRRGSRRAAEEGLEQGLEKGREEGLEQGRALLCRQAALKFDAAAGRRLAEALADVGDADRLAEVGDWIIECRTPAELFARLAGDEPRN